MTAYFLNDFKTAWIFQMTANFPDAFKTVRIFQMTANFPDDFKTVRIFQMIADFPDHFQFLFRGEGYHKGWSAEIQEAGVCFSLILSTYLLMDFLSFQLLK